jgi:phosphatidylserine/phosphatidylglycerophosphate/cardiolipin synthase-like enzyme
LTINGPRSRKTRLGVHGVTAETGRFNFTASAEARNGENVLVLHDPGAGLYRREWERLWGESEPAALRY